MKRRWSILFWSALSALIGFSWLTRSLGIPLSALVSFALLGMIAAAGVAFYAMIRGVGEKWPAAVVLVCVGPMAAEIFRTLPEVAFIVHFLGLSYALIVLGTIATVVTGTGILAAPPPKPPTTPQVPSARVVD